MTWDPNKYDLTPEDTSDADEDSDDDDEDMPPLLAQNVFHTDYMQDSDDDSDSEDEYDNGIDDDISLIVDDPAEAGMDQFSTDFTPKEMNVYACMRECGRDIFEHIVVKPARSILPKKPDFEKLRPNFGWVPVDRIKKTLENSSQFYHAEQRFPM